MAKQAPQRYLALDGLRGLAAVVVVVHHCVLAGPAFREPLQGWAAAFTHSPLRLVWAGPEAVLVFFVLSGFVLALPWASGRGERWLAYYPRRLVRLYLPALAALAVAALCTVLLRDPSRVPEPSSWLRAHLAPLSDFDVARDAVLVLGADALNSPMWSLQWEVLFSLALPAYLLLLGLRTVRASLAAGCALLGLVLVAPVADSRALAYLPMFGFGVLLCRHRDAMARVARGRRGTALLLMGLSGLAVPWWAGPLLEGRVPGDLSLMAGSTAVGAVLVVLGFLGGPAAAQAGGSRSVQWLGQRSFSLYLVHEPLVVSVAVVLGPALTLPLLLLVAVPLSLVAAEGFARAVELPAHRLSRRVGIAAARAAAAGDVARSESRRVG